MKKFNSLEILKSLLPDDYNSVDNTNSLKKQFLEAHYSVKGRAGTPVIIIKGFSFINNNIFWFNRFKNRHRRGWAFYGYI